MGGGTVVKEYHNPGLSKEKARGRELGPLHILIGGLSVWFCLAVLTKIFALKPCVNWP